MKAKNALKLFNRAVEEKGYKFIAKNKIEKDDIIFQICDTCLGKCFVKQKARNFLTNRTSHLMDIETLGFLKNKLGLYE